MGENLLDAQILIKSKRDATWQGVLRVGEREHPFKSEMELLLLINKLVGEMDGYVGWMSN